MLEHKIQDFNFEWFVLYNKYVNKYVRNCPECGKKIEFKTKETLRVSVQKNALCISCRNRGKRNPCYKKIYSIEKRKDIGEKSRNWILSHWDEHCEKHKAFKNSRPAYDIWVEKYGKDIADKKRFEANIKRSNSESGSKNPMFGKPSPKGSGNGWSGWYKGWYFRSFLELSYMIKVIEKNNLHWESAEKKELAISYVDSSGKQRTYFADFLVDNCRLVECKPRRLIDGSKLVSDKTKAAKKFCKQHNLKFEILEPEKLTYAEIKGLYDSGKIKFIERYEKKWK